MKTQKIQNPITEGVIWKQLLIFFFPIAVGTLFQQLYNTVDAVIVGRFVGKQALAAVGGSASVLAYMVIGFFTGLSAGATVIISQSYGARKSEDVNRALHTAYAFSLLFSLAISAAGFFAAPYLLEIMNTPADTLADSTLYLRIYFLGIVSTLVFNMGASILRAVGDSRRPLYYLIVCCAVNIFLDLIFVVVLDMGVAGAAAATVIAQTASAALVTRALCRSDGLLHLSLRSIRIHPDMLKEEFRLGLPGGIQALMYSLTNIIIQTAVNQFGTDTAAAWAAFGKVDAIFWTITGAFGIAVTTFSGQNFGAGKTERVRKSLRVCLSICFGVDAFLIAFLFLACRPLFQIFTTDPAVIDIGVYMLKFIIPSYLIYTIVENFSGTLRGMGRVMVPTLITLSGVCLVRLPWVLFIVPMQGELSSLLLSYPVAWTITALLLVPYYFHKRSQLLQNA